MNKRLVSFLEGWFEIDLSGQQEEYIIELVRSALLSQKAEIASLKSRLQGLEATERRLQDIKRPIYSALREISSLFDAQSANSKIALGIANGCGEPGDDYERRFYADADGVLRSDYDGEDYVDPTATKLGIVPVQPNGVKTEG